MTIKNNKKYNFFFKTVVCNDSKLFFKKNVSILQNNACLSLNLLFHIFQQ